MNRRIHVVVSAIALLVARDALAEQAFLHNGPWELFTSGRVGGFLSYTRGDGYPVITPTQNPFGGGINANTAAQIADPTMPLQQPTLESMRLRSGFLGNILGVGVRNQYTEWTTLTGYLELWSDIESETRRKYLPMPIDVRQGYLRAEGPWGTLTVGRQLTLYSRGAAEIDFLYGHQYGLGFPGAIDSSGPAAGHVGTGVIGPGFGGGAAYATPGFHGLQLTIGIYDPVQLQGAWPRTKWARPEGELTYDRALGTNARLHLFGNGIYQRVYKASDLDSVHTDVYGVGYGGRIEVGRFHLGLAGHYGQGLGLYYALETTEAAYDEHQRLRKSDGYYAQAQLAMPRFDVNAGVGLSRVYRLSTDGVVDANGSRISLIDYQLGMSAVFVYHFSRALHADLEYFRAQYHWYLGEHQNVNFINSGVTMTW